MSTVRATVLASAVTLALLAAWTLTGLAGSPARVRVLGAWVMAPTAERTGAYFTITDTGDQADELLGVSTPDSSSAMLARHSYAAGVGRMTMLDGVVVPAHTDVRMTPYTTNVMIQPRGPLPVGREVPFTLVFRYGGTVRVTAVVVPPGAASAAP
ncbi:copper chaperone PCu(A)C [Actinoallomurus rhizosphaericola]|uniref:copper chaperone PCu(A)C n=1 Tax=Actinoallomurus rhizosphaericola TaxID=2952536 RepID=UPI002092E136|nr:copper chaperone PCu(A)C [Actinoallomurus rhizosphaericola]MCO6000101.1 copper chaperone PCu(A)C [Actinoallomurus rhizosphaericola]